MISSAWLLAAVQLAGLTEDLGGCRQIQNTSERLACYDALTPAQTAPASEPPAAAKPADTSGASSLPPPPEGDEPARVEAHLFGKLDGWRKGTRFVLDNGQVWLCVDDQEGFDALDGNAVTIGRDRLGSYWMHVARVASDIRVRREQ